MGERISCFEITNFQDLETLTVYLNSSRIRILIQIEFCKNRWYTNRSIKEQTFLDTESNKLYSSHQEKRVGTSMYKASSRYFESLSSSVFPIL